MGRLDGKVAVITGATSGIGLRSAEVFVAEGAKIVVAGRRVAEGEALAKRLGADCIFLKADVTVEEQVRALIALAVEKFGSGAVGTVRTSSRSLFRRVIPRTAVHPSTRSGRTGWVLQSLLTSRSC